mmetsp:Transcript_38784/g.81545  ORF Transcript_38784/g.81545 Transcript_38784/m.81545 type:complete len:218 (+) Transcript_38784:216-869(+)
MATLGQVRSNKNNRGRVIICVISQNACFTVVRGSIWYESWSKINKLASDSVVNSISEFWYESCFAPIRSTTSLQIERGIPNSCKSSFAAVEEAEPFFGSVACSLFAGGVAAFLSCSQHTLQPMAGIFTSPFDASPFETNCNELECPMENISSKRLPRAVHTESWPQDCTPSLRLRGEFAPISNWNLTSVTKGTSWLGWPRSSNDGRSVKRIMLSAEM